MATRPQDAAFGDQPIQCFPVMDVGPELAAAPNGISKAFPWPIGQPETRSAMTTS